MDQIWSRLVQECLVEAVAASGDRAVAGAPFSQKIKKRAQAEGLEFPPAPFKTFRLFIESFKDIALVQRRPGRDILIVPADRPDMLSAELADSNANRIRDDLFRALTQIPKRADVEPFYLPASDEVLWFEHGTAKPAGAVQFPKASFDQELADRKSFIESDTVNLAHTAKAILSQALESTSPLGAFSNAVRNLDLATTWHRFRMSAVLVRLQRWSAEHGIQWKAEWITESTVKSSDLPAAEQMPVAATEILGSIFGREFLTALAGVVTDDDLARIKIPLDLVAKAWGAGKA